MTYPAQPQGGIPFAQPSAPNTGDKFEAAQHQNHLLLVYPKRFEENIKTTKGMSDAADVDIIVVDKPGPDGKPLFFSGARLFGNLARSVRNDLGGQVLGRLKQIQSANGNTPWILENFNDQEAAMAGPVHQAYVQGMFKQPQAPAATAPAAPAQWQGQPSAPAPSGAPQQQWQQPAPAAPQAQWNAPAPTTPAAAPTTPAPQQWQQPPVASPAGPPAQTAPPAAASPAPTAAVDPNLVAFLQSRGITLPPGATQDDAVAIANSLPQ